MSTYKPFSQACENNKHFILNVLHKHFKTTSSVLEVGSGTGQHAVLMASEMPHLMWQPSDREQNIEGIESWLGESSLPNLLPPLTLDVTQGPWPLGFDAVFSANTLHIMSWHQVQIMLAQVSLLLPPDGLFVMYGPFKYAGDFTSTSNRHFDQWLKSVDASQGIRDFESVETAAVEGGLTLLDDVAMPANNQMLIWKKGA